VFSVVGRFCTIYVFLLLLSQAAKAQQEDFRFVNYNVKDGLPEKFVYSATQDQEGYMWFGTGTGLYRYDGFRFQKFRSNVDEPGRSISNVLNYVATDKNGILWLASLNCKFR
jgi:ligand-binding sensor domain-containing protein